MKGAKAAGHVNGDAKHYNVNGHAAVPEKPRQKIVIYYGTQTGTAEKFAKSLSGERKQHFTYYSLPPTPCFSNVSCWI